MTDDRFYRTTFLVNMADSSDEDAAAAVFVMLHTSRKRKKRDLGAPLDNAEVHLLFVTFRHNTTY